MEKIMDEFHLTDPELLESFELDEYADQDEIRDLIMRGQDQD